MLQKINCSDSQFYGQSDSQTIQNAIDYATQSGIDEVIIPRYNARTDSMIWNIDKCILLPSNMTVVLENCHLRMVDDIVDNMFRNKNAWTPEGNTLEGEQHDIRIIGQGHAVIDGGKPSNLCEQLHRDFPEKYPHMQVNLLIFLHNVRHFVVSNIQFRDSRYWATCFMYCRWGKISDLDFKMYGTIENQDGIDLRIGCEYITISNITGVTGDDTIALTALPNEPCFEGKLHVEGKSFDTHDIAISNVMAATHGCALVRFLCEEGAREYNITVDGVKDSGEAISCTSIVIGTSDTHFADPPHKMGDFRNIIIRNVSTCAQRGMLFAESIQDMVVENVSTFGYNEVGLRFDKNFECKNLTVRNVWIRSSSESLDSVLWMYENSDRMMEDFLVENVYASKSKYVFREHQFPVKNLHYEEPTVAFHTPETTKLDSPYGRYHYMAYGKIIENRPKDNRFDGTLRDPHSC